ncbi:hypothetical protein BD779DRAFT_1541297 [Infundibulicybe gibba]|nr:hypothetical protein BD779DRAFT_1541297 [Infundibulicybe gibba]
MALPQITSMGIRTTAFGVCLCLLSGPPACNLVANPVFTPILMMSQNVGVEGLKLETTRSTTSPCGCFAVHSMGIR